MVYSQVTTPWFPVLKCPSNWMLPVGTSRQGPLGCPPWNDSGHSCTDRSPTRTSAGLALRWRFLLGSLGTQKLLWFTMVKKLDENLGGPLFQEKPPFIYLHISNDNNMNDHENILIYLLYLKQNTSNTAQPIVHASQELAMYDHFNWRRGLGGSCWPNQLPVLARHLWHGPSPRTLTLLAIEKVVHLSLTATQGSGGCIW